MSTVARYERLALRRSWFLRIFILLGGVVLFVVNLIKLTHAQISPSWPMVGLPALIPQYSLRLINLGQSVVAVFLAVDFLRRDQRLDTSEVVYTKPVSNLHYLLGKAWASISLFLVIDLFFLLVVLVFNLVSKEARLDLAAYLQFLVLLVVPSLLFVVGISLLVMSLVRNQAITFLLMLGYIALFLFYLKDRGDHLFDFLAFRLPVVKSDIIGFDQPWRFLYHRLAFFLAGLSFLFFSALLLRRLPSSVMERWVAALAAVILLAGAAGAGWAHLRVSDREGELRRRLVSLNDRYAGRPVVTVVEHEITLEHQDRHLSLLSRMLLRNDGDSLLPVLLMNLNPGLRVREVTDAEGALPWRRELHLLHITPRRPLRPGDTLRLCIVYGGTPVDAVCYPDIDTFRAPHTAEEYKIPSSFGYVTPRYVLLTPELLWYPVPGTTFSRADPSWYRKDFVRFSLRVKDHNGLRPVSQGMTEETDSGMVFRPRVPLPQISLSLGDYVKYSITVDSLGSRKRDSLVIRVFAVRGHDYFAGSFPELDVDTVRAILRDFILRYEERLGLHYPFAELSLVEVPIQFHSYRHLWSAAMENGQPMILYMAEHAATLWEADLRGYFELYKKWYVNWSREQYTDKELMAMAFGAFLHLFRQETGNFDFKQKAGGGGSLRELPNPYNIFPQYTEYRLFVRSGRWPVINRILDAYLMVPLVGEGNQWVRMYNGLSPDEKANMRLQEKSFHDLLASSRPDDILDHVISLKGRVLFLMLKAHMEDGTMVDTVLYRWLECNAFRAVDFGPLADTLSEMAGFSLENYLDEWFYGTRLPGYLFTGWELMKVKQEEREKYLLKFRVANPEGVGGVIEIEPATRGHVPPSQLLVKAREAKEVHMLLDKRPFRIEVNTFLSKNIPMFQRINMPMFIREGKVDYVGTRPVALAAFRTLPEGTLLVDNEDEGFELEEPGTEGLFYKLLQRSKEKGEKYAGISWWAPISWTLTTGDMFYGKGYVRSAWFVRSGKGNRKARWKIAVPEAGYYTVYYYLDRKYYTWGRVGDGTEYLFTIRHGEVTEEVSLPLRYTKAGWNSLGGYFFPADTAVVELSDKTFFRLVVADAVKLVK